MAKKGSRKTKAVKKAKRKAGKEKTSPFYDVAEYEKRIEGRVAEAIAELRSKDVTVRKKAIVELGELKAGGAVKKLITVLRKDSSGLARWDALDALEKIKDRRAVKALTETLLEGSPILRRKAADVLGSLGDRRAVQPLKTAADKDPNPRVRVIAKRALRRIEG